jgi:hypothetical protein
MSRNCLGLSLSKPSADIPANRAAASSIKRTGLEWTSRTPLRAVVAACWNEERPSRGEGRKLRSGIVRMSARPRAMVRTPPTISGRFNATRPRSTLAGMPMKEPM